MKIKQSVCNLHLLVVMTTAGYGRATAPAGWEAPQVCRAGWNEVKITEKKEEVAQLESQVREGSEKVSHEQ